MDHLTDGSDPKGIEAAVIAVALQNHLVSQYTSLVAIDQTPQGLNPSCKPELLPVDNTVTDPQQGTLPQTATPAALMLMIGMSLMAVALIAMKLIVREWGVGSGVWEIETSAARSAPLQLPLPPPTPNPPHPEDTMTTSLRNHHPRASRLHPPRRHGSRRGGSLDLRESEAQRHDQAHSRSAD